MDPVTHITAGALGGQLAKSRFGKRPVFWFCIAAAWVSDIDNLAGFLGPELYLLYHRGITHSVIGGVALALALAAAFRLLIRDFPFVKGIFIGYACIVLHIFLDLITSYGTQIFSPVTTGRYSISSVFIVDPLFTLVMILFLVSTRLWRRFATKVALAGLGWVLLYPMLCFGVKEGVASYYVGRLGREGVSYLKLDLSTEVLSPFLWKLVLEDEGHYHLAGVNIFHLRKDLTFDTYAKPPAELTAKLEREISMLKTFLWFAQYPTVQIENEPDRKRLLFNDLRFFTTVGFTQRSSNSDRSPFALVIELDADDRPLNWQYSRPGGTVVVHYLE